MEFASPFDEAVAHGGPASVFLRDHKGLWRLAPDWSRDCWGRAPGPHAHGWTWLSLRDQASGFRLTVLATSPTLIVDHPRFDIEPGQAPT